MNFYELLNTLQNLIKNRKLRQADIARALGTSTSNLSQKFANPKTEVTVAELLRVQDYFGVQIFIKKNEFEDIKRPLQQCKTFGQRLNYLMGENELTIDRLARDIGVSESLLEKLGLDKAEPDLEVLRKLKNYFHVSLDTLVDGTDGTLSQDELKILEIFQKAKKNNLI